MQGEQTKARSERGSCISFPFLGSNGREEEEEEEEEEREMRRSSAKAQNVINLYSNPNPFAAPLRRWILSHGQDCISAFRLIHTVGTLRGLDGSDAATFPTRCYITALEI